jgi:hypothetical protein
VALFPLPAAAPSRMLAAVHSVDVREYPLGTIVGNRFRVLTCPRCSLPCIMYKSPHMPEERPIHDLRVGLDGKNQPNVDPRWCEVKAVK